jgi:uncharacterized protein (DUF362 family)
MRTERRVVAVRGSVVYPTKAPFDPACAFPEYPFGAHALSKDNAVYEAVRQVLFLCGLDVRHFDTPSWNPLGEFVQPGGTVLIKPNWVRHYHLLGEDIFSVISHPAVLRALVDYAYLAVGPCGQIWVMDAPQFDTDFAVLCDRCQLEELHKSLQTRGVPIRIADLRSLIVRVEDGVVRQRIRRDCWESEGVEFNLGDDSELSELGTSLQNVFGSDYDRRVTASLHSWNKQGEPNHRYRISRRVLQADLVISVPKLKTHKKTGVTLNIKNMIGINTDKNYIPHYRVGSPCQGGDEFPDDGRWSKRCRRWLTRHTIDLFLGRLGGLGARAAHTFMASWLGLQRAHLGKKAAGKLDPIDLFYRTVQGDTCRTGNWWGNDTCWRCALDINKILLYGTEAGYLSDRPVRRYFSVVDGIVGGDGDGPMWPRPRPEGVLVAGFDPLSVDRVAIAIMGFDPDRIRDQKRGNELTRYPLTDPKVPIRVQSNWPAWQGRIQPGSDLGFRPHFAWSEYLESAG